MVECIPIISRKPKLCASVLQEKNEGIMWHTARYSFVAFLVLLILSLSKVSTTDS